MKSLKENFQKADIVIIGSGIIGKFNALELLELGFQISIIDPAQHKNSSNAALGLLMGNIYQKRKGRSWNLREQSMELWPKWIDFLREFNTELKISKPLIQITTNKEKFRKIEKFINDNNDEDLKILGRESIFIKNINKAFQTKNIMGIISHKDGRINPVSLLQTLDIYLTFVVMKTHLFFHLCGKSSPLYFLFGRLYLYSLLILSLFLKLVRLDHYFHKQISLIF